MEPTTLSEPVAEALDKLKAAASIIEEYGDDGTETAFRLVEQALELLAP